MFHSYEYDILSTMLCHIICFVSFRFVSFRFDLVRFVSICFVSFRFVSFRFDLFCFVPFRFCSVSRLTGALRALRNLHVDPLSLHTSMRNKQVEFNP